MSAHRVRESWENNHFPEHTDEDLQNDLRWAWGMARPVGPPYGREHHEWVAARAAIMREARRRGLDLSVTGLS